MNDFVFEQSPWEAYLLSCKSGTTISAWNLLSLLENEDDDVVDDAFAIINQRELLLDLSGLPLMESGGQTALRLRQEEQWAQSGLPIEEMDSSDPLRLYLQEISSTPAFGEEGLLVEQLLSGSDRAAQRLVSLGLSRVVEIASTFAGRMVLLLDLIQEGNIGLWEAIQTYSGGDFPAYRDRLIQNAIDKAILLQARNNGIARKMSDSLQQFKRTDEALLVELGRNPSLEEIADRMNISPEEAQTIRKNLADIQLVKQAEELANPRQDSPEDDMPVEDTAYFQMRQRIGELLSQLEPLGAQILTLRFGLEHGLPKSPEETARALNLTVGEVTARENAALAKLRSVKE